MYLKELKVTIVCTPEEWDDMKDYMKMEHDRELDAVVEEIQGKGWPSMKARKLLLDGRGVSDIADELGVPVKKIESFAKSIGYTEEDPDET